MTLAPERGELYWVEFDFGRGVEQQGRRPALIVQNDRGNKSSDYTVVVILSTTKSSREYPFIVSHKAGDGGLNRDGHVNCAHMHTIDKSRLEDYIGRFDVELMMQVDDALRYELDL